MRSRAGAEALYPFPELARRLLDALDSSCARLVAGQEVALAFSGGLDSSLLAHLSKRHGRVWLYVAGKAGCPDMATARMTAATLELPLVEVEIEPGKLDEMARTVAGLIEGPAEIEVAVSLPFAFVCGATRERIVMTGTGADELFGGYARYSRLAAGTRRDAMLADHARLKRRGAALEAAIAGTFERQVLNPYLAAEVESVAIQSPEGANFWLDGRKCLLRAAALEAGLPVEIASRPKKAAQYGSGVARMLAKSRKGRRTER
jgi:asparagine synthase (glutamine-hydrolysing)